MTLTRIELSGKLLSPPVLRATPSGRAVLRLHLDCGEEGERLFLDLVIMDQAARDLAPTLRVGQRIRADGVLRAVRRRTLTGPGAEQIEAVAVRIHPERQPGEGPEQKVD